MSVSSQITRLTNARDAIAAAITAKGVSVPSGTKIDGLAAYVGNIRSGGQPWNLLDNSLFLNPVNQRGNTSVTANGYFIDRWSVYSADESIRTASITSDGIQCGGAKVVRQIVPKEKLFGLSKSNFTCAAGKKDGTVVIITDSWTDSSGNFVFPLPAGTWAWAAMYLGTYTADTLPEYQPKGYGAELAECQRYFYRIKAYWKWIASGICASTTTAMIPIQLPKPMRINPTVTIPDVSKIKIVCGAVSPQVPSAVAWNYANDVFDIIQMEATVNGATNGDLAMLYFDYGGIIDWSADL
jgi:hypothetical protein|nr:MAG TPA_asm: tail fiber protein [Caudoviricetes sp.]